ncbi:MAG: DUF4421 family protein [Cyclobacteriaceae bacterium]|nr:DUF4421 family protein [Cyclobacteriaceae bacterium]
MIKLISLAAISKMLTDLSVIPALLLCVIPASLFAQQPVDSLRAHYVEEFPKKFSVWPVLKQRDLYFTLRDQQRRTARIEYESNNSFTFGFGAYLFDVTVEVAAAIPLSERSKEIYGESDARDWQINMVTKKFTTDAYYQKYTGFYIDDKSVTIPPGTPYPQRGDISTRNYGVGGVYVLNNRRFSLRSAFNFVDRQIKSNGSFLIGGSLNFLRVSADSAIISTRPPIDPINTGFVRVNNTTLAVSGGYSYTLVYNDFFLNGTMAIGPGNHWISYESTVADAHDTMMNLITTLRIGLGYNSNRLFGGLSFAAQSRSFNFEQVRLTSTSSIFRVVIGYRFAKVGVLKKQPRELLPIGF